MPFLACVKIIFYSLPHELCHTFLDPLLPLTIKMNVFFLLCEGVIISLLVCQLQWFLCACRIDSLLQLQGCHGYPEEEGSEVEVTDDESDRI